MSEALARPQKDVPHALQPPTALGLIGILLLVALAIGGGDERVRDRVLVSVIGACVGVVGAYFIQRAHGAVLSRTGATWGGLLGGMAFAPLEFLSAGHAGYIFGFALPVSAVIAGAAASCVRSSSTVLPRGGIAQGSMDAGAAMVARVAKLAKLQKVALAVFVALSLSGAFLLWQRFQHPPVSGAWRSENGAFQALLVQRDDHIEGTCQPRDEADWGASACTVEGLRVGDIVSLQFHFASDFAPSFTGEVARTTITGEWSSKSAHPFILRRR